MPLLAGLLCLVVKSRVSWERLNLGAFTAVLGLSLNLGSDVAARGPQGAVVAMSGFLRADALSAVVIGLTSFVSLACAIYAVGYFRRDEGLGRITRAQL